MSTENSFGLMRIGLATAEEIRREYPKPSIRRRNTGYAVDLLLRQRPFAADGAPFNLCTLLAGSEGTLALATEFTLKHMAKVPSLYIAMRNALIVKYTNNKK